MCDVTLLTQPDCGPCKGIKKQLATYGIPFTEINIQEDAEAYAALKADNPNKGTPALKHGPTYIRSTTDILAFIRSHGTKQGAGDGQA